MYDANAYLVKGETTALVDTGMNARGVLQNIQDLISFSDLDVIVLTHMHHDHTGAAPEIINRTDARILIHETEVDMLGDDMAVGSFMYGQEAPHIEVDGTLEEGDTIVLGDDEFRVLHTPGHSPGSICLYGGDKQLFSGDTVFPHGSIGRVDLEGGSGPDLVKSVERLTKLDVERMYPGHMEITYENVNQQIQQSLRFAKRAL